MLDVEGKKGGELDRALPKEKVRERLVCPSLVVIVRRSVRIRAIRRAHVKGCFCNDI